MELKNFIKEIEDRWYRIAPYSEIIIKRENNRIEVCVKWCVYGLYRTESFCLLLEDIDDTHIDYFISNMFMEYSRSLALASK